MTSPGPPVPPQAITELADDLHERLAMQTGLDPELDDWGEWWRQQVAEALEAAAPHLAAAERERCAQLAESEAAKLNALGESWAAIGAGALEDLASLLRQGGEGGSGG